MADRTTKWQQDFQRARGELAKTLAELQRWELMASQTATQRGNRASHGAAIRGKVSELKVEFERLQRELDGWSPERDVTRKSISQYKEDLAQACVDLGEMQRRSRGSSTQPPPQQGRAATSASPSGGGEAAAAEVPPSIGHHFVKLAGEPPSAATAAAAAEKGGGGGGMGPGAGGRVGCSAELQPVMSQKTLYQQQQQLMRDFEEPLSALQGTVENIGRAASSIASEVSLHNRMLDETNEATDRVVSRMGRVRTLMLRFGRTEQSNKCLICCVFLLLLAVIFVFLEVRTP